MQTVYVFNLANDHKWHQHLALLRACWRSGQQTMTVYGKVCAEQNVHLTAFGGQPSESIPLQMPLFADDLFVSIGGR